MGYDDQKVITKRYDDQKLIQVWMASGVVALLSVIPFLVNIPTISEILRTFFTNNDIFVFFVFILITPAGIFYFLKYQWENEIKSNIPKFLGEFTEGVRSGASFMRALEMATENRTDPFTKEMKKVVVQLSWGVSFDTAMKTFSSKVRITTAQRFSRLITEAYHAGAKGQQVLEVMNAHYVEENAIDQERKSQLRPFIAIVYIGMLVFLVIDVMLDTQFFSMFSGEEIGNFALVGNPIDSEILKRVSYHLAAIISIFGGVVAGKIGEGSLTAGLKHSSILLLITFVVFHFFVTYQ